MWAFLGLDDSAVFHRRLCCLVLGLYSKTQVSSLVMTLFRNSGSSYSCYKMPWNMYMQWVFCFLDNSLDTIFCKIHLPHAQVSTKMVLTDCLIHCTTVIVIVNL